MAEFNPITSQHPDYDDGSWKLWRDTYKSGRHYINHYLEQFSELESAVDYERRKSLTPIPGFAKAEIENVKKAIFSRMLDVLRDGGSQSYRSSISGAAGGVDMKGSTMNWFIGQKILPELLVMSKVGIFVDSPSLDSGITKAAIGPKQHPYCYIYPIESLYNYVYDDNQRLMGVNLKDCDYSYDSTGLPLTTIDSYRRLWIAADGFVHVQFYNADGKIDGEEIILSITEIPIHIAEIPESLLKEIAHHQLALLNLESSDISFLMRNNTLYVEQVDDLNNNEYLKKAKQDYQELTSSPGFVVDKESGIQIPTVAPQNVDNVKAGPTQGRRYGKNLDRPEFISPQTDLITASLAKQAQLKEDIRSLTTIALSNMAPADQEPSPEAGLLYIGLVLQLAENAIARIWAQYENTEPAIITYPKKYSLKSFDQVQKEIDSRLDLTEKIPSPTFRTQMNLEIINLALGSQVSDSTLKTIQSEIQSAKFYTSDPKILGLDLDHGLVGTELASSLRGYPKGEVVQAQIDQANRLALIQKSQTIGAGAARGIPDASVNPTQEANIEKVGQPGRGVAQ